MVLGGECRVVGACCHCGTCMDGLDMGHEHEDPRHHIQQKVAAHREAPHAQQLEQEEHGQDTRT